MKFLFDGQIDAQSRWHRADDYSVNYRRNYRKVVGLWASSLDIASFFVKEGRQGTGIWTEFVQRAEAEAGLDADILFVENVISERFCGWFRRNKWIEVPPPGDCPEDGWPNFYKFVNPTGPGPSTDREKRDHLSARIGADHARKIVECSINS